MKYLITVVSAAVLLTACGPKETRYAINQETYERLFAACVTGTKTAKAISECRLAAQDVATDWSKPLN